MGHWTFNRWRFNSLSWTVSLVGLSCSSISSFRTQFNFASFFLSWRYVCLCVLCLCVCAVYVSVGDGCRKLIVHFVIPALHLLHRWSGEIIVHFEPFISWYQSAVPKFVHSVFSLPIHILVKAGNVSLFHTSGASALYEYVIEQRFLGVRHQILSNFCCSVKCRCKAALDDDGIIIVKENHTRKGYGFFVDLDDCSIIRCVRKIGGVHGLVDFVTIVTTSSRHHGLLPQ